MIRTILELSPLAITALCVGRLFWAALFGLAVILDVDWDVVLSIVLGLAGIGYVVIDHRRVSKLDEWGQSLGERVASLEAQIQGQSQHTIPERLASLESRADEIRDWTEDIASIRERLATAEARIDFKPITHTRRKDGKFGRADETASTCTDEERRR